MPGTDPRRSTRVLGLIVLIAGVLLAVAGAATYFIVSTTAWRPAHHGLG